MLFHITRKAKLKFLLSKNFTFVRVFLYHTEQNKKKLRAFPKVSNHDHMWAIWWKRVAGREDPSCRKDSLSVTIVDMDAFEINSYDGNEGSGSTMSSSQGEDSLISSAHSPSTQPAVAQSTDEYPSVAVAAGFWSIQRSELAAPSQSGLCRGNGAQATPCPPQECSIHVGSVCLALLQRFGTDSVHNR